MSFFASIPLLFISNSTTNSGIVNKHGLLIQDTCTTFSGSISDSLITKAHNFGEEVPQYTYITTPTRDASIKSSNIPAVIIGAAYNLNQVQPVTNPSIIPIRKFLKESPRITTLDSLLNFSYGIILDTKTKDLNAYLNIVSISDIIGYVTGTERDFNDLVSFIRGNLEEFSEFTADITVNSLYLLKQIFVKDSFVYAAVTSGLEIFDINTGVSLFLKKITSIRTHTLWGNDETLFLGGEGKLLKIAFSDLHTDYNSSVITESYLLSSETINYIHGKNKALLIATDVGVEYINWEGLQTIRSSTVIENVSKCFLTNNAAYYINTATVSGVTTAYLNKKQTLVYDWILPTIVYGAEVFGVGNILTDMYITENTASNGGNTIFCATTSGIYVIDEDSNYKNIYYTR
jgi:hypothetical protein